MTTPDITPLTLEQKLSTVRSMLGDYLTPNDELIGALEEIATAEGPGSNAALIVRFLSDQSFGLTWWRHDGIPSGEVVQ